MGLARTRITVAHAGVAVFMLFFAMVFAALAGAPMAYADFAVAELSAQDDSSSSVSVYPTQLKAAMVAFTDQSPTEANKNLTTSLTYDSKALTSGTHYTYTSPSTEANTDNGKTFSFTGKDSYAGKVTVNYKIAIDGANVKANFVQIRYNATDGFKVSLGPAAASYTGNLNVPSASKELSGKLVVSGKGDWAGQSITVSYSLTEITEIRDSMVLVTPTNDGTSLNVVVTTDGTTNLVKDADYTLGDFIPSGADGNNEPLHVLVKGIESNNFTGTVDFYCVITGNPGSYKIQNVGYFPNCTAVLSDKTFINNGKPQKPSGVTVKDGTTDLVEGTDYEVNNPDNSGATGTYQVVLTGKGNYRGTQTLSYSIDDPNDELKIELADSHKKFTYKGSSQQPVFSTGSSYSRVTVEVDGTTKTLTKDKDYSVEFWPSTTVNAGEYTVTVKGLGDYTGSSQTTFTIEPAQLSISTRTFSGYNTVSYNTSPYEYIYYYTGKEIKPTFSSVSVSGVSGTLKEGTDYTIDTDKGYLNNTELGGWKGENPPTVVLQGKGNFTGTDYAYFTIAACPLNSTYITCTFDECTYTGKAQKPEPKSVKITSSGYELKKGTDFVVNDGAYANNTNAGTATAGIMAVEGGKFDSSVSKTMTSSFKITGKKITASDVNVSAIASQTYTGSAIAPAVTIKDSGAGKTLTQMDSAYISLYLAYYSSSGYDPSGKSSDFYVEYSNNTNPGTATAKITGMRNYTGTRTVKFPIKSTGTIPKVKATDKGNGMVLLKWDAIYKATKYRVLEKTPKGSYNALTQGITSTACRISNLSVTRTHRFLVQAYVGDKWSSKSDAYLVSCKPTGASKPTIRAQSYSNTAILVSWDQVPGASRYALYEKVGKKYQLRSSSYTYTSVRFTSLKKKKSYTYCIRALVDGKWSKMSNKVTFSPADPNSPVPTATAVAGKKGQIKLTWAKTRNAKKYMVQVQQGKKWKTLTKNCKALTYTAKGLAAKKQTFRVRAYGNGKWSKIYTDYYATATPDNA